MKKKYLVILFVCGLIIFLKCQNPTGPDNKTSGGNPTGVTWTMVTVPGGSFQRDSIPSNVTTVATFKISNFDVTRAQYLAIMKSDPSNGTYSTGMNDPVQNVSWYQALVYCNLASAAEGLTPVYSIMVSGAPQTNTALWGTPPTSSNATWDAVSVNTSANGYRLPTNMEWMWAAMGATAGHGYVSGTYTSGYSKPFAGYNNASSSYSNFAWTSENSNSTTHPVAGKMPNELGLYDMSGNVWQWCRDAYGSVPSGAIAAGYQGPASVPNGHVLHGGAYDFNYSAAGVTNQYYMDTIPIKASDFGFRVARNY